MTTKRRIDLCPPQKRARVASSPPPAASTINWADLPEKLLLSVLDRLPCYSNLIVAGAVCRSWHVAACSSRSSKIYRKICCLGAGSMGGLLMPVIAYFSVHTVTVVDPSPELIESWNSDDDIPLREVYLHESTVEFCRRRNLSFSTDVHVHVREADIIFISARNLGYKDDDPHWYKEAADMIAEASDTDKTVVVKSYNYMPTVARAIEEILNSDGGGRNFQVLVVPELVESVQVDSEYLSEPIQVDIYGPATPEGENAVRRLKALYADWVPEDKIITRHRLM